MFIATKLTGLKYGTNKELPKMPVENTGMPLQNTYQDLTGSFVVQYRYTDYVCNISRSKHISKIYIIKFSRKLDPPPPTRFGESIINGSKINVLRPPLSYG